MKRRVVEFITALRAAGLRPSPAESMDAVRAVALVGVAPLAFREVLAATLIKDEADRPLFDDVFSRVFGVAQAGKKKRPNALMDAEGSGSGRGAPDAPGAGRGERDAERGPRTEPDRRELATSERGEPRSGNQQLQAVAELARTRFAAMTPRQVEACPALAGELARRLRVRTCRRLRVHRRGRIDVRRTARRATSTGGVPLLPVLRRRRPGRPDLVALCDVSFSVAAASDFLLRLLAPSRHYFRHVTIFGFVDEAVEVSFEAGRVIPHDRLDLYARSDFGRTRLGLSTRAAGLWTRNTILLVLGDARNNRRPPRADLLLALRRKVRRVYWLNPEPGERWNTGDSVLAAYLPACDGLFAADSPKTLQRALANCLP